MWSYYGSKSKLVNLYPEPKHDLIIEPFAGLARYAFRYWDRDVILVDKYEGIYLAWMYVQNCSDKDIDSLPNLKFGDNIRDFNLSNEEISYLSFVVSHGSTGRYTVTKRAEPSISNSLKELKENKYKVKHWDIRLGSYKELENTKATWFIDPPYIDGGKHYKENNIDYKHLGDWCKERNGQIIVCENNEADWLPFNHLIDFNGQHKKSKEVVYYQDNLV